MAAETAVSLLPSAARTGAGDGASVDVLERRSLRLWLEVTAIGVAGSLVVVVETARTSSGPWRTLGTFTAITAVGQALKSFPGADRYVRARWTLTGAGAAMTFAVVGVAVQVYASIPDFYRFGARAAALPPGYSTEEIDEALEAATDFVTSRLTGHDTPLTAWGDDLRRATAIVAAYDVMQAAIGVSPEEGQSKDVFERRYLEIVKWLDKVAAGDAALVGVVDATPETTSSEPDLYSGPLRGW